MESVIATMAPLAAVVDTRIADLGIPVVRSQATRRRGIVTRREINPC
jgi:hypothetical protein